MAISSTPGFEKEKKKQNKTAQLKVKKKLS